MDSFNSFTLRDNLNLTMPEFEMAVSLIDGLDLTRREVSPKQAERDRSRKLTDGVYIYRGRKKNDFCFCMIGLRHHSSCFPVRSK